MQELKIKITTSQEIEEKLNNVGATFVGEEIFTDTYFNQPQGEVLKLANINEGYFLIALKAVDGKFDMIKNQAIENADPVKIELANEYGIKCILSGKRRIFQLESYKIILNHIDNVGEFLILTGINPTPDFIINKIGVQNPEYINVAFDELAPKSK